MEDNIKDIENKTRTDYKITILEGQKMSDVFHEVGLPTHIQGERKVTFKIYTDEVDEEEIEIISRVAYNELVDWGFLDDNIQHDITIDVVYSKNYKLKIYTE